MKVNTSLLSDFNSHKLYTQFVHLCIKWTIALQTFLADHHLYKEPLASIYWLVNCEDQTQRFSLIGSQCLVFMVVAVHSDGIFVKFSKT